MSIENTEMGYVAEVRTNYTHKPGGRESMGTMQYRIEVVEDDGRLRVADFQLSLIT